MSNAVMSAANAAPLIVCIEVPLVNAAALS
jgi:hypothetical protein